MLYPVPHNRTRGVFVEDHVHLLRNLDHDVKVVNPLPRMPRYAEARRSTMMGWPKHPNAGFTTTSKPCVRGFLRCPTIRTRASPWPAFAGERVGWRSNSVTGAPTSSSATPSGPWPILQTNWPADGAYRGLVVHGHDFDVGLDLKGVGEKVRSMAAACNALVCATDRLGDIASALDPPPKRTTVIPCVTDVHKEWRRPVSPMKKTWKKEPIDILFLPTRDALRNDTCLPCKQEKRSSNAGGWWG